MQPSIALVALSISAICTAVPSPHKAGGTQIGGRPDGNYHTCFTSHIPSHFLSGCCCVSNTEGVRSDMQGTRGREGTPFTTTGCTV